jgi:hypothetical protein
MLRGPIRFRRFFARSNGAAPAWAFHVEGFGTVVSVLPGRVIILQVVQGARPRARARAGRR